MFKQLEIIAETTQRGKYAKLLLEIRKDRRNAETRKELVTYNCPLSNCELQLETGLMMIELFKMLRRNAQDVLAVTLVEI